jgi:hypothetical protein
MLKSKYFYFCLAVVGWLFWMDARGAGGSVGATGNEEPLPQSVRDNPGAYRAQLALSARSFRGK